MGLFDHVKGVPKVICKYCFASLDDNWQSNDGPCELLEIPFGKLRYFYNYCSKCAAFHQYRVAVEDIPEIPIEKFILEVRK
jgi:hypothetical protein